MDNVTNIDDHRPHIAIVNGNKGFAVPVAFFEDVINGRRSITDLENLDDIMPVIIGRWLEGLELEE